MFKDSLKAGRLFWLQYEETRKVFFQENIRIWMYIHIHTYIYPFLSKFMDKCRWTTHKKGQIMQLLPLCLCARGIQTPYPTTDELLLAHDKSPPVCGISVVAHVRARPDPTASALSPTTWGTAWMTDWPMGESHLTKGLSDWSQRLTWAPEGAWHTGDRGPQESESLLGSSTWHPAANSPTHGSMWSASLFCVCMQAVNLKHTQCPLESTIN